MYRKIYFPLYFSRHCQNWHIDQKPFLDLVKTWETLFLVKVWSFSSVNTLTKPIIQKNVWQVAKLLQKIQKIRYQTKTNLKGYSSIIKQLHSSSKICTSRSQKFATLCLYIHWKYKTLGFGLWPINFCLIFIASVFKNILWAQCGKLTLLNPNWSVSY